MKKLLAIVISMAMIVAMMPMGVFATVGTEENTNLINAINALSKENHTLVLPEGTTWPEATTVYWKAGDQSGFEANLTTALTNSYKADKGDITIVCKPNADVGPMTHGHVADSITIYGNGAYVSDGECDLEVDTYKFSRSTGAQADNGSYLEKAITITAYELDNLGVWGQRNTNNTINVNLIDCDGKAVEGKNNLQRVYISGKIGKNNITLTDCDFITAATSVYSNAVGTIAINKCSFKNSSAPVNLNNKSGGVQNITIADCTFEDCATTVNSTGWKNFAAPIRIVASENGSTSNVEINNAKISYTGENKNVGNGDVLLGDGRQNEKSAGNINLTVKRTNATIQQQQPGYYDASGSIDANKMNSVNATLDQTVNTDNGNLVVQETPLTDYVIVKGIKGMENHKYISIDSAYAAGNAILAEADNGGLVQNGLSNENFDKLFTDKGNITWTIYGKQNFDETNQPYLLTFGRKAKHYSNEKHIGTITLKGGNNDKIKDIVNFKTNATLNYEWWGEKIPDVMVVDNITMNVQKPDNSSLSFSQAYNDGINLTINNCIVNGGIYFYNNQPNDITFTNNIFNGVNGIQNALFIQGHKTEITKATIIGNTISGYDRAMNLNQDTGVFIVKDNTITPGTGYSAIQVSSCSSATIENNKIILNDKTNVLTIHESFAERNLKASININNNTINIADGAKAYLVYDDINASGKEYGENAANVTLNWGENNISGNFDNTKGIKKETEYAVSEYIKTALKNVIPKPVNPVTPSTPTDNVTNNTTDKNTTADLAPAVKDNKAETTVDAKTADKIVEKALENKSEEIIVDAAGNNTVASSEVGIPEKTVKEIAEKTDANLVIKTDNGKVDLDRTALEAVAEQAGTDGTVKLAVETVKTDENICHVELKLITSNGAVKDFRGGNVKVTINLTKELAAKDVVCVYINDNGIYTLVEGVLNADGTYTFTTGHFSEYAVMAKGEADKKIAEQLDTMIKDVNLKVRTSKTAKKNIKAVVSGDITALTDAGYTVKYKFYRSTKKASKYVSKGEKTADTYINTAGKKGTKYYYKAKAMVYSGDTLVGQTVLKQCKYGVRTWSK